MKRAAIIFSGVIAAAAMWAFLVLIDLLLFEPVNEDPEIPSNTFFVVAAFIASAVFGGTALLVCVTALSRARLLRWWSIAGLGVAGSLLVEWYVGVPEGAWRTWYLAGMGAAAGLTFLPFWLRAELLNESGESR